MSAHQYAPGRGGRCKRCGCTAESGPHGDAFRLGLRIGRRLGREEANAALVAYLEGRRGTSGPPRNRQRHLRVVR